MTTETVAAMAEVVRVGGWALRGLGYPFGVAERGIRLLAWAEAVHGQALRSLRLAEEAIIGSAAGPAAARVRDGEASWRIDGAGKHLLEVGPPAVDLLTADARRHGKGHVRLSDVIGAVVLAALTDLAARRDLFCIAVCRSADADVLPESLARSGWIAALPGRDGSVRYFAGGNEAEADRVIDLLSLHAPSVGDDGIGAILNDLASARSPDAGGQVGLSAFRPEARAQEGAWPGEVDYGRRLADGYRLGLPMEAADLAHLYDVERRTWAPTSERSRLQAGYGVY